MDQNKTCIEMAFDLARSGQFTDLELLERRLHDEGYSTNQLAGPSLRRQVRALMVAAAKTQASPTLTIASQQRTQMEKRMPKSKPDDRTPDIDLEQDLGTRPAEPVETDSNDTPAADANGDSDDERADENQAVPDGS